MIKSNELLTGEFAPTFFIKENRSTIFKLRKRAPETIVFFLFLVSYCIITTFHEPWFDEAQAWQIAKCASIADILFEIPHYEGHPPLWHLILAIPAKLGLPFELGLKSVGCIFSTASVFLILYKCCYPRFVRLILPFTYFVFYQYGIIVRPYCLMLLIMLLLGLFFPNRFSHPWRYVGLLSILCLTSAYGMLIACGIALCMAWEITNEKGFKRMLAELRTDKRTASLLILLVIGILFALIILPKDDTYISSTDGNNSFFICLICSLFTFMEECLLTTSSWFSLDVTLLQKASIDCRELIVLSLIGVILWILIISFGKKENLKYLLIPYCLFAFFSAIVYFSPHHLGIAFLLLLFWIQISLESNPFELGFKIISLFKPSLQDIKLAKLFFVLSCIISLFIPVSWNITAIKTDVELDYSYGRRASLFLTSHSLDNSLILSQWGIRTYKGAANKGVKYYANTCEVGIPVLISAYYNRNVCYNLNHGDDDAYMRYRIASHEENEYALDEWRKKGYPTILLGRPDLELLFDNELTYDTFTLVDAFELNYIWKTKVYSAVLPVFCRNDIMKEYNLSPMSGLLANQIYGLRITDSLIEQYNSSANKDEFIDSILNDYFKPI